MLIRLSDPDSTMTGIGVCQTSLGAMYMKRSSLLALQALTITHICTYSGELKEAEMYMDHAIENANQMLLNARDGGC